MLAPLTHASTADRFCVCLSDAAAAEVKFTPGMKQNKFEMLMTKEEMEEEQR